MKMLLEGSVEEIGQGSVKIKTEGGTVLITGVNVSHLKFMANMLFQTVEITIGRAPGDGATQK